ncbi:hypothetical protein GUJ93_ZPchr0006g41886 [Zizania palustris]|uniref:Transcription elongation factor 1 homolog n=1 Tax=Zizania palustris TaxID=103762 RepID=A0A8J5W1C8_ZIZPA|nr:hypothetical protein GUJ93_ZPchr0006g41886 [Zizania palustris]
MKMQLKLLLFVCRITPKKTEQNKQLIMGKRKSRAKPPPNKKMNKVDTVFCCPFCNHSSSVECSIDLKDLIGVASCIVCLESFSTTIHALTEPIDIYSDWIDECERVNNRKGDT